MPSPRLNVGRTRSRTPPPGTDPRGEAFAHRLRPFANPLCASASPRRRRSREENQKKFSVHERLGNLLDSARKHPLISRSGTRIAHTDMSIAVLLHAEDCVLCIQWARMSPISNSLALL
jgi:hypothetical protein